MSDTPDPNVPVEPEPIELDTTIEPVDPNVVRDPDADDETPTDDD